MNSIEDNINDPAKECWLEPGESPISLWDFDYVRLYDDGEYSVYKSRGKINYYKYPDGKKHYRMRSPVLLSSITKGQVPNEILEEVAKELI